MYAKYQFFFNNYFVVIILNNGRMIGIKNIFLKIVHLLNKGFLYGEKILVQYTYNAKNKNQNNYRSQLINFLCSSPVHHSCLPEKMVH